jgi:hypothetical protein
MRWEGRDWMGRDRTGWNATGQEGKDGMGRDGPPGGRDGVECDGTGREGMLHLVVEIKWNAMGKEAMEWEWKGREGMVHLMVEMWLDRQDDHVALHHQLHIIHCEIHAPKSNELLYR